MLENFIIDVLFNTDNIEFLESQRNIILILDIIEKSILIVLRKELPIMDILNNINDNINSYTI